MEKYIIKKRNGSKELYNSAKIARVMGAAGLSSEQTKQVVSRIEEWLSSLPSKEVSSIAIRDKLIEILPEINKVASDLFIWYQKTKERNAN